MGRGRGTNMMTCEEARGATVLAAYGELEVHRQGALRAHLISCAECAAQARDVQAARELVARAEGHDMSEMPVAGPPRTEFGDDSRTPERMRTGRALAWSLAVAVVLVIAGALLLRGEPSDPPPMLASGAIADGASEPLAGDAFDDEIESLQTELSSLESRVGEF